MIGFDAEVLLSLSDGRSGMHAFPLLKPVVCDGKTQREMLQPVLDKVSGYFSSELIAFLETVNGNLALQGPGGALPVDWFAATGTLMGVFDRTFQVKNPSFREELEWRVVARTIAD